MNLNAHIIPGRGNTLRFSNHLHLIVEEFQSFMITITEFYNAHTSELGTIGIIYHFAFKLHDNGNNNVHYKTYTILNNNNTNKEYKEKI